MDRWLSLFLSVSLCLFVSLSLSLCAYVHLLYIYVYVHTYMGIMYAGWCVMPGWGRKERSRRHFGQNEKGGGTANQSWSQSLGHEPNTPLRIANFGRQRTHFSGPDHDTLQESRFGAAPSLRQGKPPRFRRSRSIYALEPCSWRLAWQLPCERRSGLPPSKGISLRNSKVRNTMSALFLP